MFFHLKCRCALLAGLFLVPPGWAQSSNFPQNDAQPAEPLRPSLEFMSSFSGYQAHTDTAPVTWQKANEDVRKIGGWRAYAKESLPSKENATPVAPDSGGKN